MGRNGVIKRRIDHKEQHNRTKKLDLQTTEPGSRRAKLSCRLSDLLQNRRQCLHLSRSRRPPWLSRSLRITTGTTSRASMIIKRDTKSSNEEHKKLRFQVKSMLVNLERKETEYMRMQRHKVGIDDFEFLTVIGRGAFGEVRLYRTKNTGEVFAMKKLKKSEMLSRGQVEHVRSERNLLAEVDS